MSCLEPSIMYESLERSATGRKRPTPNPKHGYIDKPPMRIPCGKCLLCQDRLRRDWTLRIVHENQMHAQSCVITVTYDDEHLPKDGKLVSSDWSKFAKRIRKKFPQTLRILAVGEYGTKSGRAHYHALIFGTDFLGGAISLDMTGKGNPHANYHSPQLDKFWGNGMAQLGHITPASAAYVAGYCFKKIGQQKPTLAYPKRPALARPWFDENLPQLERSGFCVLNGKEVPIPQVYMEWAKGRLDKWKDKQLEIATRADIGISEDTRRYKAKAKAANLKARMGLKSGGSI